MKLDTKTLQELKDEKIRLEDLNNEYFVASYDYIEADNVFQLLNSSICDFKQLVDRIKKTEVELVVLLKSEDFFESLIKNNKLTKDDLKYVLSKINNEYEITELCEYNSSLIKHILNKFVLDKEIVDRLNEVIEKIDWCKEKNIHTVFDLIEYEETHDCDMNEDYPEVYKKEEDEIDKELLELNELNRKVYMLNTFDLTEKQRDDLIELIQNNETAKNRLIQIVDNHLEDHYNIDSLMQYLKKVEKKNILNI